MKKSNNNDNPGFIAYIYDAIENFFTNTRKGRVLFQLIVFAVSILSIWIGIWCSNKNTEDQGRIEVIHMINQLVAFQSEGIEKNTSHYEMYSHDAYRIMTDSVSLDVYREVINDQKVRNYLDTTAYAYIYHVLEMAEYAEGYVDSENASDEGKVKSIQTRDYLASEINELLIASAEALENKTDHDTLKLQIDEIIDRYENGSAEFYSY